LTSWEAIFDVAGKQARIEQLRHESAQPGFWDNAGDAQQKMQELDRLEAAVDPFVRVCRRLEDVQVLIELAAEEEDPESHEPEVLRELEAARAAYAELEMADLLSGPHDAANAIMEVNAGAGGTEACDWAQMLLRMYVRWAERRGFKAEVVEQVEGEVAGIKSATLHVQGRNAYGYLKSERGVHRMVRISPFDANKRRHTSFAAVDVIPEIEESEGVQIDPDDLRIDTFLSSGAGGANVQ
jgi:peptide chain release factor 2